MMKTPEPPGPSFPITDPSVQMVRSALGSEERWSLAQKDRRVRGSDWEHGRDKERETENAGWDQGGKGGEGIRGSRGEVREGRRG